MDKLNDTIASVADAISNAIKPNYDIIGKLSTIPTAFEKAADIGKITEVTFAPALKTAFDAFDTMEVSPPHRVATYG